MGVVEANGRKIIQGLSAIPTALFTVSETVILAKRKSGLDWFLGKKDSTNRGDLQVSSQ